MIDDTKQNKIEGIKGPQETILVIKKEVIGIFLFNICWWFLKTSVVPLAIYPYSPPLVEGGHLVQAL